jgi:hypothetical protein
MLWQLMKSSQPVVECSSQADLGAIAGGAPHTALPGGIIQADGDRDAVCLSISSGGPAAGGHWSPDTAQIAAVPQARRRRSTEATAGQPDSSSHPKDAPAQGIRTVRQLDQLIRIYVLLAQVSATFVLLSVDMFQPAASS